MSWAKAIQQIDRQVRTAVREALEEEGVRMERYYRSVVADWVGQPGFESRIEQNRGRASLVVVATGDYADRWYWVDRGTRPHIIRPKRPGYPLRFRGGYSARTQPVAQANVGSGRATGAHVSTYVVFHPGTEPRHFRREALRRTRFPQTFRENLR